MPCTPSATTSRLKNCRPHSPHQATLKPRASLMPGLFFGTNARPVSFNAPTPAGRHRSVPFNVPDSSIGNRSVRFNALLRKGRSGAWSTTTTACRNSANLVGVSTHCLMETFGFFPDNPYYQERFYGVEIRFWRFTDGSEGGFCLGGARAKPVGRRGRCQKAYCWCHEHSLLTASRWLKIRRVRGCYFDYSSRLPGMTRPRPHFSRARASAQHLRQLPGAGRLGCGPGTLMTMSGNTSASGGRPLGAGQGGQELRSKEAFGHAARGQGDKATTRVAGARLQQRVAA